MICNVVHALSLSDLTNFFKTNKPPTELFGIKLLENINKYSKDKILSFDNLEHVYGDDKINVTYLQKLRWVDGNDLVVIKNDNFDIYNIYVNEKLEIEGIDGANVIDEDEKFQTCLNTKTELINKIVKLYDLDINSFKEQNYIWSGDSGSEMKNSIISQSFFKFSHAKIDLIFGLACEIDFNNETSTFWIELMTEKSEIAIYSHNYSKTKKSIEQLLSSDLKGI